jgi:SAM-dependent methyltransferase
MPTSTISRDAAVAQLKAAHRTTWATGDYPGVAEHIAQSMPAHVINGAGIGPGDRVLDVATGTGNAALAAARYGAAVTGLDLTPDLLDVARQRAAAAGVDIDFVEGDCEALPFSDGSFDGVLSVVGVQFAPRHAVTAAELVRVCSPSGGVIGLANWTPEGVIGQLFRIMGRYLPAPPPFASAPPLWGDEAHVRSLFAGHDVELSFERGHNAFRFGTVAQFQAYFEQKYGPMIKAREALGDRWPDCQAELRELYDSVNQATDGTCHIEAEYLVVLGHKAA